MRISRIKVTNFRRFADLEVREVPPTARLVVLAGPNGSGKSSLFDALLVRYRNDAALGYMADAKYYGRHGDHLTDFAGQVTIETHGAKPFSRGALYVRTAYRHDPEFETRSLTHQGDILERLPLNKLIETDATVANNYARLASQALEDVLVSEAATTTLGDYREKLIGEIREPLQRLFPDLRFVGVGNPMKHGSFQFDKGATSNFDYKNLSGGEKAAFDLILDFVVKRKSYKDAIYCIDEPEAHINTKIQGTLLQELLGLLPDESQLWIASHSIGMMRKARELHDIDPSSVVFLDFGDRDFDLTTIITPAKPTRTFWQEVLNVALDDLATLVAPREVVICEGNPLGAVRGKNAEHDARVYSTIFNDEYPDVTFISAGNSKEVAGDYLGIAAALPKIASGMKATRLIDRDDHSPTDIAEFRAAGVTVLGRRHIESYLYDDEVLTVLCETYRKPEEAANLLTFKQTELQASIARGNPADDIKSVAGPIYVEAKKLLGLTQAGNDQQAFARNTLAPLIRPGMQVYDALKNDVF